MINRLYLGLGLAGAFALALGIAFFQGKSHERTIWEAKMAEASLTIANLEARQPVINEVVITQYVDRVRYIDRVQIQERTIREFIPVEVDQQCIINRGFITVHNSAAALVEPPMPTELDTKPSNVQLSEVTAVIVENYTRYHLVATQLESLQTWVREQQALWNNHE